MSIRRYRGRWGVDIRYRNTRYRACSPEDSRAGAQAYEAYLRREIVIHGSLEHLKRKGAKVSTFAEFIERWMHDYVLINNKPSEQRSKEYMLRNHLLPFFGKKRLDQIDSELVQRFKKIQVEKRLHPKTINNHLTVLHRALVIAKEWGESVEVPMVRFLKVPPSSFKVIGVKEFELLIECIENPLWRAMAIMFADTGLRFSELAGLKWEEVDLQGRQLCVRYAFVAGHWGTPKNGRVRYVPLTVRVSNLLASMAHSSELVFHRNDKPIIYESVYSAIERGCKRAGIPRISPHTLRHTFASELVSRGGGLQAVQGLLGHATITMTLRYAHLAPSVLRSTIHLLEDRNEKIEVLGNQWATDLNSDQKSFMVDQSSQAENALNQNKNTGDDPMLLCGAP